jgi:hypothetical protein
VPVYTRTDFPIALQQFANNLSAHTACVSTTYDFKVFLHVRVRFSSDRERRVEKEKTASRIYSTEISLLIWIKVGYLNCWSSAGQKYFFPIWNVAEGPKKHASGDRDTGIIWKHYRF